jgi:lipoprotein-releasing system permease protein
MSLTLFLTKKYFKSKKDSRFISAISVITIFGITLGVTVVIMALSILDGFENVVSEKIINFNSHIKVTSFGNRNLTNPAFEVPYIQKQFGDNFTKIQPFVSKLSIIKSSKVSEGITLLGINPESSSNEFKDFIKQGSFDLSANNSELPKIILGEKLADKLFVKIGSRITIFSLKKDQIPTPDDPPAIMLFTVSGIYESGISEYDDLNAFIDMQTAQNLFGMGDRISGYNIKIKNISNLNMLADSLQNYLRYPYYVRTIFQIHQNIFTWIELQKKPIPIVLGLIIFVAVFNIISTLLIIVLERIKTIGILRSLGSNRKLIIKLFLVHSFYLTIFGIISGNALAFILSIIQKKYGVISLPETIYFVNKAPIFINPNNYLLITCVTLVVATAASLLPAWIASRIQPISAIKFD